MNIYLIMQPDTGIGDMLIYDCNEKVAVNDFSARQKILDQRVAITSHRAKEMRNDGFRYWQGRNNCRSMSYVEFPSASKDDAGRIRLLGMLFENYQEKNAVYEEFESTISAAALSLGIELASVDFLKLTFDQNKKKNMPVIVVE
jgi:hypothetical protein